MINYQQEYYIKNKETIQKKRTEYYENNKEKVRRNRIKYYYRIKNKKRIEYAKEYYQNNKQIIKDKSNDYLRCRKYYNLFLDWYILARNIDETRVFSKLDIKYLNNN